MSYKFDYVPEEVSVEAYGKKYVMPAKTMNLAKAMREIFEEIDEYASDPEKRVISYKRGIALFIGAEETERLFPAEKEGETDMNELLEFFMSLNAGSSRATQAILNKYAPNGEIRG